MIRGLVAGEINQVNGSGSGHNVNGGSEDENCRENDDAEEIVLEVKP